MCVCVFFFFCHKLSFLTSSLFSIILENHQCFCAQADLSKKKNVKGHAPKKLQLEKLFNNVILIDWSKKFLKTWENLMSRYKSFMQCGSLQKTFSHVYVTYILNYTDAVQQSSNKRNRGLAYGLSSDRKKGVRRQMFGFDNVIRYWTRHYTKHHLEKYIETLHNCTSEKIEPLDTKKKIALVYNQSDQQLQ